MKKIGEYTMRGSFDPDDGVHRIILDDGRFDTGYRIVKVTACLENPIVNEEYRMVFGTTEDVSILFDWGNNIQIAWAYGGNNNTVSATFANHAFFDPDNMIIQDLYLIGTNVGTGQLNYMIEFEKYEFQDDWGALNMVRNRSQA